MVLQPSEERRRSGSHYTPRALTEPIVRTALEPVLARLRDSNEDDAGQRLRPEQILDIKICDPAMGSGAFLVEACRQLGDALVEAWRAHDAVPEIPPDEDEVVFARRLIAQHCLYGVDRNPVAVDLAKVSLWLATLARDHAFTFLDHALRHGDSLVGLSRRQLEAFHWEVTGTVLKGLGIQEPLKRTIELRRRIQAAGESTSDSDVRQLWDSTELALSNVRLFGDLVLAAFFEGNNAKERKRGRSEYEGVVIAGEHERYRDWLGKWRHAALPLVPFHWEVEFPEVFERDNPGFDAFVGNPPFQGGRNLSATQGQVYSKWLITLHKSSSGGADLVAHFFRRAFNLLRDGGALGLIATNTIAQGDTRASGLRWICEHGGEIFSVRRRVKWPGLAAVVVSVLHIGKGSVTDRKQIDGRDVERITAFLFHRGRHDDPARLKANADKSFQGSIVLGMGFTFDDTDTKGVASPLAEMHRLTDESPRNQEVIFPYIGGQEVNNSPTQAHHRFVINFGDRSEEECWRAWPGLMAIVEHKVKPIRITKNAKKYPRMVHEWWKYWNPRVELHAAIAGLDRVLVISRITSAFAFTFLPAGIVYNEKTVVFPYAQSAPFAVLQSRTHEVWARFFSSTLEDRLQYTPSDCFET